MKFNKGMSLDSAVMDLSDVFEFGQGYVALSRVRRLSGLYILGWNKRAFQVNPEILTKDEAFRLASCDSETTFSKISPTELQERQDNFITVCGGKQKSTNIENLYSYEKKNKMSDTYGETLVLWNEGKTILQIAKARGFKERTIFDHIEKLVVTRKINHTNLSRLLTPSLTHDFLKSTPHSVNLTPTSSRQSLKNLMVCIHTTSCK